MVVPVIVPPQTPSPRSQELGQRLASVIEEYQQQNGRVEQAEILAALQIARSKIGGAAAGARITAVLSALLGLGVLLGVFYATQNGASPELASTPFLALTIAGLIFVVLIAMLAIRRRS